MCFTSLSSGSSRVSVLAGVIKGLLPRLLQYIATYGNTLVETLQDEAVGSCVLAEGFLTLLSAVLERNSPKQEHSAPMTSTASGRVDSSFSRLSDTSAISVDFSYSVASVDTTPLYVVREREISMHRTESVTHEEEGEEEEGGSDDGLSECSDLHAHLLMNLQHQMGSMCLFALIWSFGAYVPYTHR